MRVEIDSRDLRKIERAGYGRQIPYALSRSINRLVYLAQQEVRSKADRHIDKGATPWTKSGIRYRNSRKSNLVSEVYVADGREYLKKVVYGGEVRPEKSALVVPAKIRLNKYGNISRGKVRKLTANKAKFFVGVPKGKADVPDNEGVWERMGRGGRKNLRQVVRFKERRYQRPIFPAPKIALKKASRLLRSTLKREMSRAIASSRL